MIEVDKCKEMRRLLGNHSEAITLKLMDSSGS